MRVAARTSPLVPRCDLAQRVWQGCPRLNARTPPVALNHPVVFISLRRGHTVAGEISAFIAITDRDWFELSVTRTAHRPSVAFGFRSSADFCE